MSWLPMFGVITVKRTSRRMPGVTPPSSTLHAAAERLSSRTSHCSPSTSERTMRLAPFTWAAPERVELNATAARTTAHTAAADKSILNLKGIYLLSVVVSEGARRRGGAAQESRRESRVESQGIIALLI